ncbi:MAG: periplasmic heavy metal sensor [Hyphomicrobium sp.]
MTVAAPATGASSRKLRLALMASLALNVLIIGGVASALCFARFGHGGREIGTRGTGLLGYARTLPRERSDLIRQKFADAEPNMELLRKGIRDARASARDAVKSESFDQSKLDAALESIVQAEANEKRARVKLFGETVSQLTPEERQSLYDWLQKRRPIR